MDKILIQGEKVESKKIEPEAKKEIDETKQVVTKETIIQKETKLMVTQIDYNHELD